jgi:SAM-dependent methyltransferase
MVRTVWRDSESAAVSGAIRADWRALPIETESVDLVLADGSYTALGSFDRVQAMNVEVRRVLRPGGHYCVRAFARPERAESLTEVMNSLAEGHMRNAILFRWRLAMAIPVRSREGVRIGSIWDAWCNYAADPKALAERNGWTDDELEGIEKYRGVEAPYYFPSRAELRELAGTQFEWLGLEIGRFECGDRFPRVAMRARSLA